ncbi:hypothetical protein FOCC_FOCC011856, partial [Frankliniella occidentalis]
ECAGEDINLASELADADQGEEEQEKEVSRESNFPDRTYPTSTGLLQEPDEENPNYSLLCIILTLMFLQEVEESIGEEVITEAMGEESDSDDEDPDTDCDDENWERLYPHWKVNSGYQLASHCCSKIATGDCNWPVAVNGAANLFQTQIHVSSTNAQVQCFGPSTTGLLISIYTYFDQENGEPAFEFKREDDQYFMGACQKPGAESPDQKLLKPNGTSASTKMAPPSDHMVSSVYDTGSTRPVPTVNTCHETRKMTAPSDELQEEPLCEALTTRRSSDDAAARGLRSGPRRDDSVARPAIRNSTQFSGNFGCGTCPHPGEWTVKGKGGMMSYSPYHEEQWTGDNNPDPCPNNCLDGDVMHIIMNIGKTFCKLWFKTKNEGKPFNISDKMNQVNTRLKSFHPIKRLVVWSIILISKLKAHEWAAWILIYSLVALKGILPSKYFQHWALLVSALGRLTETSVRVSEVYLARRDLEEFVAGVHTLYSMNCVTFNVHLLTNLSQSVQQFGNLWTHSAFLYES